MIVVAIGGAGHKAFALLGLHTVALHQAGDAILAASMSQGFELGCQTRTAVTTFRPLLELPDRGQQPVVGLLPVRGFVPAPGMITGAAHAQYPAKPRQDRKSTRLNSSHPSISYAVFCLKK